MSFWTLWLSVVLFLLLVGFREGSEIIAAVIERFRK